MSANKEFWEPIVGESWYDNFHIMFDSEYMKNVLNVIGQAYKTSTVYPLQGDIFKIFKLVPFNKVRVVIIGQDPYYTENNGVPTATGVGFGNSIETSKLSPSLIKIHEVVEKTCYDGLKVDFDYTLEEWAEQGVLLLNTALTVNKFKPGSHTAYWDGFIRYIIEALSKSSTDLHFFLWGNHAQSYSYLINPLFHYIYEAEHPAYAARQGRDWKCAHFSEANTNFILKKDEIIKW